MGKLRDLAAAATIGIAATTKQKDAESNFEGRLESYKLRVNQFDRTVSQACARFEELDQTWNEAKDAVIGSGALTVDPQGNLSWGWFSPSDLPDDPSVATDATKTVSGSLPGIVFFIGAPAITWSLVGIFGTAGTGVAISSLSGAAFTTATAAWLGRLGIAGITGLGVRAAPAVLGGIGLVVSMPIQIAVGAKVAGNRERKTIGQIEANSRVMHIRSRIISEKNPNFEDLGRDARETNSQLLRAVAEFQVKLNIHGIDSPEAKDSINGLLQLLFKARELCIAMKEEVEETERLFLENPFPDFS